MKLIRCLGSTKSSKMWNIRIVPARVDVVVGENVGGFLYRSSPEHVSLQVNCEENGRGEVVELAYQRMYCGQCSVGT